MYLRSVNRIVITLFFISGLLTAAMGQTLQTNLGYALGLPTGDMGKQMDPLHGFHIEVTYGKKESRFSAGIGFQMGWYGRYRRDVEVSLDGLPVFDAPMVVQHHMAHLSAVLRYDLIEAGPIVPFAVFRPGWLFAGSRLEVRDPNRSGSAEGPINLFDETLHRDNAFAGGLGIGARVDLALLFGSLGKGHLFFEAEAGYQLGAELAYAFSEREGGSRGGAMEGEMADFDLIESDFHDLHRYRSVYSMISFRAGLTLRISPPRDE